MMLSPCFCFLVFWNSCNTSDSLGNRLHDSLLPCYSIWVPVKIVPRNYRKVERSFKIQQTQVRMQEATTCVRMSRLLAPAKLLFLTFRLLFVRSLFVSSNPGLFRTEIFFVRITRLDISKPSWSSYLNIHWRMIS